MIGNSFVFASGGAAISLVVAGLLAWVAVRTDAPGRALFELVAVVPNVLPPLLTATAWVLLLSPRIGLINVVAQRVGLPPFNVYSMAGMIFVEGVILAPLAYLIISAALSSIDPSLQQTACSARAPR